MHAEPGEGLCSKDVLFAVAHCDRHSFAFVEQKSRKDEAFLSVRAIRGYACLPRDYDLHAAIER